MVPHHFRIRQKRNSHIISYRPPIRCQTHVPCSIYRCRNFTRANNIPHMTLILPRAGSQRYPFYCYSLNPTFWAYGPVCKCNPLTHPLFCPAKDPQCVYALYFFMGPTMPPHHTYSYVPDTNVYTRILGRLITDLFLSYPVKACG